MYILAFYIDKNIYGLPLEQVDRVVPALAYTELPRAPEIVQGVIDVAGSIVPVIDFRKRFGLEQKAISIDDQLILAHNKKRPFALFCNQALGIKEVEELPNHSIVLVGEQLVKGVARLADGLVLIHDLNLFLTQNEDNTLDEALRHQA